MWKTMKSPLKGKFQFRIPYTKLCDGCREILKNRYKEYRRMKHREEMMIWRIKKRSLQGKEVKTRRK